MVAKPRDDIRTGAEGHGSARRGPSAPPPKAAANDLRPLEDLANKAAESLLDQFTLSSGVTLRLKKYNRMLIRDIITSVPDPEPPVIHDPDRGIDEVNEQDPAYQQALADAFSRRDALLMDFVLMMATELDELKWPLPPGIPSPASDEWLAVANHIGYSFDPRHLTRYLAWLKIVAIRSIEDSTRLSIAITRLNGTLEEDVAAFVAAFPGDVAR